jgi:hypothetical protein
VSTTTSEAIKAVHSRIQAVNDRASEVSQSTRKSFAKMRSLLMEREEVLLAEVESVRKAKVKALEVQYDTLGNTRSKVDSQLMDIIASVMKAEIGKSNIYNRISGYR